MTEFNRYWAEEALGEPYVPQDYSWMKSTRRAGMLLGGVTCVLTTGALLGAAVYYLVDPAPRISISSYEVELVTAEHTVPPTPQPLNITASKSEPGGPPPSRSSQIASTAPQKTDPRHVAAATLVTTAPKAEHAAKAPAESTGPAPAALQAKPQLAAAAPAPAPAMSDRATPAPAAADRRQQAKSQDTGQAPKLETDTRIGLSKAAESKPTDIASGEKLGIREILPDGIVMQNGRRVKNGSPLPNGEILMGTDAAKGMAETDRRVLVLTP